MNPHVMVIGGGIAGLAAAHALSAAARVTLVEASPRLGGKLHTERVDGFLVEAGADSFGTRRAGALELVEELGLASDLVPTPPSGRVLVLANGRIEALPGGLHLVVPTDLGEVFRSPLLPLAGKLRVALDLARRRPRGSGRRAAADEADEAVAPFLRRHFGRRYVERIAAPLLGGIHATDPERLSLRSAFPGLAMLEQRWGSLIRGARGAPPGPSRVTLARGMGSLVDALARRLGEAGVELVTGRRAVALHAASPPGSTRTGFALTLDDHTRLTADGVILATPSAGAAGLLAAGAVEGAAELAAGLGAIPLASTATVSLGFRRDDVRHPLDALGLLVPAGEGRAIGACTFASSKFEGRAPEGAVLVRAYLPGARGDLAGARGDLDKADEAVAATAVREVADLLGVTGEPLLVRVHRFEAANPQYVAGHRARVAALEAALPPGLALAGCAYHGVGIPDCIASGVRSAAKVLGEIGTISPSSSNSGTSAPPGAPEEGSR
jgi:oxygen-dependent protoporphyrinogen oxidase